MKRTLLSLIGLLAFFLGGFAQTTESVTVLKPADCSALTEASEFTLKIPVTGATWGVVETEGEGRVYVTRDGSSEEIVGEIVKDTDPKGENFTFILTFSPAITTGGTYTLHLEEGWAYQTNPFFGTKVLFSEYELPDFFTIAGGGGGEEPDPVTGIWANFQTNPENGSQLLELNDYFGISIPGYGQGIDDAITVNGDWSDVSVSVPAGSDLTLEGANYNSWGGSDCGVLFVHLSENMVVPGDYTFTFPAGFLTADGEASPVLTVKYTIIPLPDPVEIKFTAKAFDADGNEVTSVDNVTGISYVYLYPEVENLSDIEWKNASNAQGYIFSNGTQNVYPDYAYTEGETNYETWEYTLNRVRIGWWGEGLCTTGKFSLILPQDLIRLNLAPNMPFTVADVFEITEIDLPVDAALFEGTTWKGEAKGESLEGFSLLLPEGHTYKQLGAKSQITATDAFGEVHACDYIYLDNNTLYLGLYNDPVTNPGKVTLNIPEKFFLAYTNGEPVAYNAAINLEYTVLGEDPIDVGFKIGVIDERGKEATDLSDVQPVVSVVVYPDFDAFDSLNSLRWNWDACKNITVTDGTTTYVGKSFAQLTQAMEVGGEWAQYPYAVKIDLEETISALGSYSVVIPEGIVIINAAPNNPVTLNDVFTVGVANTFFTYASVTPENGAVAEKPEQNFVLTFDQEEALAAVNEANGLENIGTANVYSPKWQLVAQPAIALVDNTLRINVATENLEAGTYTIRIPEMVVTAGVKNYNQMMDIEFVIEDEPYTYTLTPEDGAEVESLNKVKVMFPEIDQNGVDLGNDDAYKDVTLTNKETEEVVAAKGYEWTPTYDGVTLEFENISTPGTWVLNIPKGTFVEYTSQFVIPAITAEYIVTGVPVSKNYFEGAEIGFPEPGINLEEDYDNVLNGVGILLPNFPVEEVDNAEVTVDYNMVTINGNPVTKLDDADAMITATMGNVALMIPFEDYTTPGTFTLNIAKNAITLNGVKNPEAFTAEYTITGEAGLAYTFDPEPGKSVASLETITITFECPVYINSDINGDFYLGNYTMFNLVSDLNKVIECKEVDYTEDLDGMTFTYDEITADGTYTLALPEHLFFTMDDETEEILGESPAIKAEFIVGTGSYVASIFDGAEAVNVYDMAGRIVRLGADSEAIRNLEPGVYVINGKKIVIRK